MTKIIKLPLVEKTNDDIGDKTLIINPSVGNCIDSNGNHYIKNSPNTSKENWKY